MNLTECETLTLKFHPDLLIVESGGDNLAATFSRELADFIIYVIDVAGGRSQSDLSRFLLGVILLDFVFHFPLFLAWGLPVIFLNFTFVVAEALFSIVA